MFAASNRESVKTKAEATLEGARRKTRAADSAKVSPIWQSLAMRPGVLQRKLTISKADDPYELEADRAADQVMRMPAPQSDGHGLSITPFTSYQAQRKCADCGEEEKDDALQRKESGGAEAPATAPPIVRDVLRSTGHPLDPAVGNFMESRFGRGFSHVRVHTDSQAAESAEALNARAYTVGTEVIFGANQYSPDTVEGKRLLAHELTHTLQQNGNSFHAA